MAKNSHPQRGDSNLIPFLGALLFVAVVMLTTGAIPWMLQNCSNLDSSKGLIGTGAGSCFEFWANRYQALIAAVIAIGTALFAGIPVWNQLQYTQRQVEQQQLQMLRQRGYELSEERNALFSVIAKLDVGESLLKKMVTGASATVLKYDTYEPGLAQNFDSFGPAVRTFEDKSGRIWGDAKVQDLKLQLTNSIYESASLFRKVLKAVQAAGTQTGWIKLSDFSAQAKDYHASFEAIVPLVSSYVDAIDAEIRRLQNTIGEMEQHLL